MPDGYDLGAVGVTMTGGQIQGVAGAGSVVIENFAIYNRAPEESDTQAVDGERPAPCPYPGLDYFGPDDSARFFGRDAAIERLATAVSRQSFTALVGASGSGKSSVVLAGLAPHLHGLGGWRLSRFRIGDELERNPFLAVARSLAPLLMTNADGSDGLNETKKLATLLQSGDLTLRDVFAESRRRSKCSRILLIADQFEEIFTLVEDDAVRHHFIDVLLAGFRASARTSPDVALILTMRADFFGRALLYRPLADALQGHVENLGPMTRDELRLAIEKPAENEKVSLESGLVETLLDDVESKPGSLPLLQFALREMWGRQERRQITRKSYDAIGGVRGALARRAEAIFAEMTENGANARMEEHFQRLFTRLVTPGEGQEDTRRIAERCELGDEVWSLAQRLAGEANRLVVTSVSGPAQETAEVVHEALIRNWPTLAGWINRDRAFLSWLRQIKPNLELWLADKADDGPLLRGGMLAQARDWFAHRVDDLSPEERRYVEASLELRQREESEREAARQAEIAHQEDLVKAAVNLAREQSRRVKIAVVGVIVSLLLAAFGGWKTLEAGRSAKLAQARASMVVAGADLSPVRVASLAKMGDAKLARGNLAEALTIYLAAHDICHRLANEELGNAGLQQEHSVLHNKIGDVYRAQLNLPDALASYQNAREIRERLVKEDPRNAKWQRDLSVSQNKIGDVLEEQGKLVEALHSYRDGLSIIDRLAKTDPGNAGFQQDLALSFGREAAVEALQGQRDDALGVFRQGRAIVMRLMRQSPDDPTLHNDLAWFDRQVAALTN